MKTIEGVLCTGLNKRITQELLFGVNSGGGTGSYERFMTNGFIPFPGISEATNAYRQLVVSGNFRKVGYANLRLVMAESVDDFDDLRSSRSLVVIVTDPDFGWKQILGRDLQRGQSINYIPGCFIESNGFRPFSGFDAAEYCFQEVRYQALCLAQLAEFKFKKVKMSTPGKLMNKNSSSRIIS